MASMDDVLQALVVVQQELANSRVEAAALKEKVERLTRNPFDASASTPQSDPSNPGGTKTQSTSNPEVLRAETNPILLPGDGWQKQPLCAVTWLKWEEQDGLKDSNAGTGGDTLGEVAEGEENKDYNGGVPDDGRGETSGEDLGTSDRTAGQCRGPGGH
ncbi:hypothetical protein NDU88_002508 [Pleurodeles waltl]|uniref:Uncharacterized protein n=1 Tax=Pleurodeles waltl TaxID=8319 RepID=A0AAV7UB12_PLEWA|nr:hypothetical protein NDU88_002508 [Pleurodeles waltl]